jgi:hypothetical protein
MGFRAIGPAVLDVVRSAPWSPLLALHKRDCLDHRPGMGAIGAIRTREGDRWGIPCPSARA